MKAAVPTKKPSPDGWPDQPVIFHSMMFPLLSVDTTKPGKGSSPGLSGGASGGTPTPLNENALKWSVIVHPVGTGVASVKSGASALANVSVAMM